MIKFKVGDLVVRCDKLVEGCAINNPWENDYDESHPKIFVIDSIEEQNPPVAFPKKGNGTYLKHLRLATPLEKLL